MLTALACATWFSTSAAAAASAQARPSSPPKLTERQTEAEAVRELRFKQAPTYKRLKRAEIAPFLRQELFARYGEGELDNLLAAYEKLGLVKSSAGLAELLLDAYASQVVAFYDEKTGIVHLIEDLPVPTVVQQIAEVHELVHALQDQHFDLSSLPLSEPHSTDGANAATALVEGDAMLATVDYAANYVRISLRDALRIACWGFQSSPDVPYVFEREGRFVYLDGLRFARTLYAAGGWQALDEAFADPPASTEQVLHPRKKYLETRDEPTPVELPDYAQALGAGWKLVAQDTLGELYTQALFRQHLSFLRAGRPSRGWDGDRLQFYRSDDGRGDESALVWRTVWDTEQDAKEFAAAYRRLLERKLDIPAEVVSAQENAADALGLVLSGEDSTAIVHLEGCDVVTVEAPSALLARALMRSILAAADEEATADEELKIQ